MKGKIKIKSFERDKLHDLAFVINEFLNQKNVELIQISHESNFGKTNALLVYKEL